MVRVEFLVPNQLYSITRDPQILEVWAGTVPVTTLYLSYDEQKNSLRWAYFSYSAMGFPRGIRGEISNKDMPLNGSTEVCGSRYSDFRIIRHTQNSLINTGTQKALKKSTEHAI
jgi:hypothetical protein